MYWLNYRGSIQNQHILSKLNYKTLSHILRNWLQFVNFLDITLATFCQEYYPSLRKTDITKKITFGRSLNGLTTQYPQDISAVY